jgi:hypothetical protein
MTGRWKKYRLLMIVATLGAFYVGYFSWFQSATPRPPSIHPKVTGPTAQSRGPSTQGAQAGGTIARTSSSTSALQNAQAINKKSATQITIRNGIDKSVIGQPFEISASVKAVCKYDTIECPLVMASVKRMAEEPRDVDWAAKMEATIQSAFDSEGPGKFVIRNVECRTSICILEVEVHVQGTSIRYESAISSSLRPHAMTFAPRVYDSSGESYSVELMDFERR